MEWETVLQLAGQYELANRKLDQAVDFAMDTPAEVKAKLQQADILYKTGFLQESITVCGKQLELLGFPIPMTRLGKLLSANKYRFLRWLRSALKESPPGDLKHREESVLLIDVLRQLTYPCLFRDRDLALWASSIADDLAQIDGSKRARLVTAPMRIYAEAFYTHNIKRVDYYGSIARAYAEEMNDRYGLALFFQAYGFGQAFNGIYLSACHEMDVSIQGYNELGDVWRRIMTEAGLAWTNSYIGDFARAQRIARKGFATAVKYGQNRLATGFLIAWLKSTDRCFPLERMLATFEQDHDDLFYSSCLKAQIASWHLKNGNMEKSIEEASDAVRTAFAYYPFHSGASSAFAVYAHALRELATTNDPNDKRGYRQAINAAKQAVRFTRKSNMNLPYSLRELALNYMMAGKLSKARRHIGESCNVAEKQGARYEYAQSLLVLGQVGEKLSKPEAGQQIEEAENQLAEFEQQMRDATLECFGPRSQSD